MKKSVIITSAIVAGIAIGGGVYAWQAAAKSDSSTPIVAEAAPLPALEEKIWKDASGFTFTYPADMIVDQHDEDQDNYAHVELTHKDHPGSLIVWAKDVPRGVSDAASWIKKDKQLAVGVAMDTTLGGEKAVQVTHATPARITVGTVYDDVLWYIEVIPDDVVYWKSVFDRVTGSFAFVPMSDAPSGASSVGEAEDGAYEEAVDEEEIIE